MLASAIAAPAAAQGEIDFPKLSGRVVDEVGVLPRPERMRLSQVLEAHENATSNQVVVVTLDSLQGRPIEEFGYRLGRHWGIGQEGKNNGVLLIVAPNERKVRIEVGYGLEGTLTDAISSNIVNGVILPAFRRGDLAGGIEDGAISITQALGGKYEMRQRTVSSSSSPPTFSLLILALIVLLFISSAFGPSRSRHRRGGYVGPMIGGGRGGFGGGGFGGGFGGGGGGFGGGGASGGW